MSQIQKYFFIIIIFISIPIFTFAIRENKIIIVGYANYNTLLSKITHQDNYIKEISSMKEDYQKKLNKMQAEIDSLEEKLASNTSSSVQDKISALEQKKIDKDIYEVTELNHIQQLSHKFFTEAKNKLTKIIQVKAKQLGFDIIIDSSLILLPNKKLDITNTLLASIS